MCKVCYYLCKKRKLNVYNYRFVVYKYISYVICALYVYVSYVNIYIHTIRYE